MSTASTTTTVAYALKKIYKPGRPANLATRDRVFFSRVTKVGGFTGTNHTVSVRYGNGAGVSDTFSTAQTNAGATKGVSFVTTRAKKYAVSTIDGEFIHATADDKGSFVRGLTNEIDGKLDELGFQLAVDLYGDGSGAIGQRSSESAAVITLSDKDSAKHFSVGMKFNASDTKTGGSIRSGTGTVTAVDEDAGKITYSGTITSIADDDYLYRAGSYDTAMKGLLAWIPATAPTSTSFFGVDRSVDTNRLGGNRVTDTTLPPEEAIQKAAIECQRRNGRPKDCYMHPLQWDRISKRTGAQVRRTEGGKATVGFEYVEIATPAGLVKVFADPVCPETAAWLIDPRAFRIFHLLEFPHIIMDDNQRMDRQASDDGVEVRMRAMGQLECDAPGWNSYIALSSTL